MNNRFTYSKYPQTDGEFQNLMLAIDAYLSNENIDPSCRSIRIGRLLWEAFGLHGQSLIPPSDLAAQPGFEGDKIMAKANLWYERIYGERNKIDFVYGFAPVKLKNVIWRVRFGLVFGEIGFFVDKNLANHSVNLSGKIKTDFNMLYSVEEFTQGLAEQLTDTELTDYAKFYESAITNLMWRNELPDTELLRMAKNDYDSSTSEVLAHRFGQARWAAQQATEKTIKGFLNMANISYPTGGHKGHDLIHLGSLFDGIELSPETLSLASCSSKIRYGEEPSTENQAIEANHAVLDIINQLRNSQKITGIIHNWIRLNA